MRSREEEFAIFIIDNGATIRSCAKHYSVSKSLVHNYISCKLKARNKFLYCAVYKVLNKNFQEKHIRGGQATKNKYLMLRNHSYRLFAFSTFLWLFNFFFDTTMFLCKHGRCVIF